MRFKILKESLSKLSDDTFITDSEYAIRDLLLNKPKAYRIFYDANIDKYMIGDANKYIHKDLVEQAMKQGHYEDYIRDENSDPELVSLLSMPRQSGIFGYLEVSTDGIYWDDDSEEHDVPQSLYLFYVPNGLDVKALGVDPAGDGYDVEMKFSHGTLWCRDGNQEDIDNCSLVQLMQRSNEGQAVEQDLRLLPLTKEDLPEFDAAMMQAFHDKMSPKNALAGHMYRIYDGDTRIGYIGLSKYDDTKDLGIGNFVILPEYRGQGYGTRVIKQLVEQYKNTYKHIYCYVNKKNSGARKLYSILGTVHDGSDGEEPIENRNGTEYLVTFYPLKDN